MPDVKITQVTAGDIQAQGATKVMKRSIFPTKSRINAGLLESESESESPESYFLAGVGVGTGVTY